jgi:hypothetical protein
MNSKITKLILCKKQFSDTTDNFLNIISFGDYSKKKNKYNFIVYHCYLIIHCEDGTIFEIDKQARVNIKNIKEPIFDNINTKPIFDNIHKLNIDITSDITPSQLLINTQKSMKESYNTYCFVNNNCQDFISALLSSNNIINEEYSNFIKQDSLKYLNDVEINAMIILCKFVNFFYYFV